MLKGNKKRPKHMQESQHSELHNFAIKTLSSAFARVIAGVALRLVDKYIL